MWQQSYTQGNVHTGTKDTYIEMFIEALYICNSKRSRNRLPQSGSNQEAKITQWFEQRMLNINKILTILRDWNNRELAIIWQNKLKNAEIADIRCSCSPQGWVRALEEGTHPEEDLSPKAKTHLSPEKTHDGSWVVKKSRKAPCQGTQWKSTLWDASGNCPQACGGISELTLKPPAEHHGKVPTCCWPPGAAACHVPQEASTGEVIHVAEALPEEDTGTGREALCPPSLPIPDKGEMLIRSNSTVEEQATEDVSGVEMQQIDGWHTNQLPTMEKMKIFTSWNVITMNMNYNSMQNMMTLSNIMLKKGWWKQTALWGRD